MRLRDKNRRIIIQRPTTAKDASGAPVDTFTDFIKRWAKPRPLGGREYYGSQQVASQDSYGFRLHYDNLTKTITTKDRLTYNSKTYDIASIVNDKEENKEIVLVCVEHQ